MDLLGILRIKDSNGNWVSVPGLKGDTGEPFKILGIYATAAALEAAVTDPGVSDVYLVGTTGAYDIYLYLADGWHNTGRYMPKGDQGDPAPQSAITSAVETWLAANVDPETGYVLDRTLTQENGAAPADLVGNVKNNLYKVDGENYITHRGQTAVAFTSGGFIKLGGDVYVGNVVDFTPITDADRKYAVIDCNPGDVFYIWSAGGSWSRAYGWLNADNKLIYVAGNGEECADKRIVCPSECTKLVINAEKNDLNSFVGEYQTVETHEIVGELYSNLINLDNPDIGTWVQGGILNSPPDYPDVSHNQRIRMRLDGLHTGDVLVTHPNDQQLSWYLFDNSGNLIKRSNGFTTTSQTIRVENDGYLRSTVGKIDLAENITPADRTATIEKIGNIATQIYDIIESNNLIENGYSGDKITVGYHSVRSKKLFTSETAMKWLQGSAIWGNYIFAFISPNTINVLDKTSGSVVTSFTISGLPNNCHGNTLQFNTSLQVNNGEYPPLYISELFDQNRIFVVQITMSNDTFTGTLIQTIGTNALDSSKVGGGYTDFAIDGYRGFLYLIRYKNANDDSANSGNNQIISKYLLPDTTNTSVNLSDDNILDYFSIAPVHARQQCEFYNGNLYFTAGDGLTDSYLFVVDTEGHKLRNTINIKSLLENLEPESCTVVQDGIFVLSKVYATGLCSGYKLLF